MKMLSEKTKVQILSKLDLNLIKGGSDGAKIVIEEDYDVG